MGEGGAGADAGHRLTAVDATVIYVTFRNERIDLSWLPERASAEVVIVHNDDTDVIVDGADRPVHHVVSGSNLGFGAAVNLAADVAAGRRLVLVNPDARLSPHHWTALACDVSDDEVVTIGLVDEAGVPTYTVQRYPTAVRHLAAGFRLGRIVRRGSPLRRAPVDSTHDQQFPLSTHWVSGAALSLATERFRACDGFDPEFFLYFEDVDLCRRLAARFPTMTARQRSGEAGVHGVGGSGRGSSWVEAIRLQSAIRWSQLQPGTSWRVVTALLRLRAAMLRR